MLIDRKKTIDIYQKPVLIFSIYKSVNSIQYFKERVISVLTVMMNDFDRGIKILGLLQLNTETTRIDLDRTL